MGVGQRHWDHTEEFCELKRLLQSPPSPPPPSSQKEKKQTDNKHDQETMRPDGEFCAKCVWYTEKLAHCLNYKTVKGASHNVHVNHLLLWDSAELKMRFLQSIMYPDTDGRTGQPTDGKTFSLRRKDINNEYSEMYQHSINRT